MAETLQHYPGVVVAADAAEYEARACGAQMADGLWHGWIEFVPVGDGPPLRSPRETTQPNRADAVYWASGLSRIYLEGALRRARSSPVAVPVTEPAPPIFAEPAPSSSKPAALTPSAILDPYSVYEKGEALLRQELSALSAWHLVNIVLDYDLSGLPVEALNRMPALKVINLIVAAVRDHAISRRSP